jgi:hypothetical protein
MMYLDHMLDEVLVQVAQADVFKASIEKEMMAMQAIELKDKTALVRSRFDHGIDVLERGKAWTV